MRKVFLDTNLILDYYLDREEFSNDAEAIFALGYSKVCSLFVSALTFDPRRILDVNKKYGVIQNRLFFLK